MFKLLIADDEEIIRNGLVTMLAGSGYGLELCTPACTGMEAYKTACMERPDIVITDIRMPEMDGISLIEKLSEELPGTHFIILSGYGEFEYAKQAMTYGVKHFILKPCNDEKLLEAVNALVEEINTRRSSIALTEKLLEDFQKVLPQFKEQFLRDYITGMPFGEGEAEYFLSLQGMSLTGTFRVLLVDAGRNTGLRTLFALKRFAEDTVFQDILKFCTIISGKLLMLTDQVEGDALLGKIRYFNNFASAAYGCELMAAYGSEGTFESMYGCYGVLDECLMHSFHLGRGAIITPSDLPQYFHDKGPSFAMDTTRLKVALKSGSLDGAVEELDKLFKGLSDLKLEENIAKTHCFELFAAIASTAGEDWLGELLPTSSAISSAAKLEDVKDYLSHVIRKICETNGRMVMEYNSQVTRTIVSYISEHLDNEELSLRDIASGVLHMNEDYVSRLFKKEMNEKFSQYLLRNRMELAEKLIAESSDVRIFEIADRTGYGSNPQSFSAAFKKYTGYTPTEYKRLHAGIAKRQA